GMRDRAATRPADRGRGCLALRDGPARLEAASPVSDALRRLARLFLDAQADLVIREKAGVAMAAVLEHVRALVPRILAPAEPGAASLLAAALRECEEEIGLPRAAVEPLGALDDTETFATNFVITPWIGVIHEPVAWRPDGAEIERVIEVPFAAISRPGGLRVEEWEREGVRRPVYFFDYNGDTIWGATARIVKHYLDLVADGP